MRILIQFFASDPDPDQDPISDPDPEQDPDPFLGYDKIHILKMDQDLE
jgi:hypothetical protein